MSFGLSARDTQDLQFEGLSQQELLAIAVDAAGNLEWDIVHLTDYGFRAFTKTSEENSREEINLRIGKFHASILSESIGEQLIDQGRNRKNTNDFLAAYAEIKRSLSPEELLQKSEALHQRIISQPQGEDTGATTKKKQKNFLEYFKPVKGYYVTPILVLVNIGLFVLMVLMGANILQPDNETLLRWGANWQPVTTGGEWWRLITCCFLHIGVIHLAFNMYALIYIGLLLEPHLGTKKFIAAYFLTGILASTASLWWHDNTISAGASGAIFGMYGVFLAMLTTNLIEKSARMALLTSIGVFVAYNLLGGMKSGVDNAAHLGGLLSGLAIGYAFYPSLKKNDAPSLETKSIALVTCAALLVALVVCYRMPRDAGEYNTRIAQFGELEKEALEIFSLPEGTPKGQLLFAIKEKGIRNWEKSITLLNEMDKLKVPGLYHERTETLLEYCHLRIKSYNLLYKDVAADVQLNTDDSITYYNQEIQEIVDRLKEQH